MPCSWLNYWTLVAIIYNCSMGEQVAFLVRINSVFFLSKMLRTRLIKSSYNLSPNRTFNPSSRLTLLRLFHVSSPALKAEKNPYKIIGVDKSATASEIKKAYYQVYPVLSTVGEKVSSRHEQGWECKREICANSERIRDSEVRQLLAWLNLSTYTDISTQILF